MDHLQFVMNILSLQSLSKRLSRSTFVHVNYVDIEAFALLRYYEAFVGSSLPVVYLLPGTLFGLLDP